MLGDDLRDELTGDLLHDRIAQYAFRHQLAQQHVLQLLLLKTVRLCHRQNFVAEVALMVEQRLLRHRGEGDDIFGREELQHLSSDF